LEVSVFSGIVETVGSVLRLERSGAGARLAVDAGTVCEGVSRGDSVCVAGACLTAVEIAPPRLVFDVSRETLERTTLGGFRPGRRVNLERALRAGDRIGGHFVQGHVDGVGSVQAFGGTRGDRVLRVALESDLLLLLVDKGSVAVDGVSLTVADLERDAFSVAVIPETISRTTLADLREGDGVNVEADILGKTVVRYLERKGRPPREGSGSGLTLEDLSDAGFL
jgi:riboflavin synthase